MDVGDITGVADLKPAQATRRSMRICPVCSISVLTGEMVEFEGQELCAGCGEGLRAKAQRRKAAENN